MGQLRYISMDENGAVLPHLPAPHCVFLEISFKTKFRRPQKGKENCKQKDLRLCGDGEEELFRGGRWQAAGRSMGGQQEVDGSAKTWCLCQILTLFLDIIVQLWAAWIFATSIGRADLSILIEAAAASPRVRGIILHWPRLICLQPITCTGYGAGLSAFQCKLGLPCKSYLTDDS